MTTSHSQQLTTLPSRRSSRGLGVTVLHTDFNAPDPARHPAGLAFVPIHETLPGEATSPDSNILTKLLALNAACDAPFRHALASLLRARHRDDDVACAVVDGQCFAAMRAAGELGVPVLALRTDSAAAFRKMLAIPRLRDAGYIPIKGNKKEKLDEPVPEFEPLRVRDLIRVEGSDTDEICGFITSVADAVRATVSGVVLNTFEAVEASELSKLQSELSLPAFAVGPLHLLSSSSSSSQAPAAAEQSLHEPDRGCLPWLDGHPPRSVLYVSLGSLACVDRVLFDEMAWGLARSGVPFLWVVRPGSITGVGDDDAEAPPPLPEGFEEETRARGRIVKWAPQREVLAHQAIGPFWTHCGWNSTLESMCEGVPMLVQPCFGDQMVTARLSIITACA
ncbi:hypothetical protein HU200_015739 [Digitaria exilis]|uniref:Uncharacterized protein n=1 Tax=Digitaria exilis TaxID=1010633 RepID=A0A835KHI1_9POAL|nr:hypothetical protein HU200_015739 [Digitaria exilis]